MNKVFNVNLGGMVFTIDEIAFAKLNNYINKLKAHFSGTEGASEIIADIEARMAELIRQQQKSNEEIVNEQMADQVISVMGDANEMEGEEQPEEKKYTTKNSFERKLRRNLNDKVIGGVCSGVSDYFEVDPTLVRVIFLIAFFLFGTGILLYIVLWIVMQPASEQELPQSQMQNKKRLFRDSDDKILGGVCSGLSHYLGLDPVWVRIFFAVALFVFGVGFWIYIALWIAVPSAITAAQKLRMKGESIDVSNIEREVKSAFTSAKQNAPHLKNEVKEMAKRGANTFGEIFTGIFKAIGKIIAFALLIVAVAILSIGVVFYFGIGKAHVIKDISYMLIDDGWMQDLLKIGLLLAVLIPVLLLIITALRLLFNLRFRRGPVYSILGMIGSIGWLLLIFVSVEYYFSVEEKAGTTKRFTINKFDTLYLKTADNYFESNDSTDESREIIFDNKRHGMNFSFTNQGIFQSWQKLKILKSENDSSFFEIRKTSRGSDREDAVNCAGNIDYNVNVHDSLLLFDKGIFIAKSKKWKYPDVKTNLFVPIGTFLIIDDEVRRMLNRNLKSHEEKFYAGKTFKMTSEGLICLDCKSVTKGDDDDDLDELKNINISIGDVSDKEEKDSTGHRHRFINKKKTVIIKDGKKIEIEENQIGPIHIKKVKKIDKNNE